MELNSDFSELLQIFNAANVKYLVIGGHAMAVHDQPRFTKDIDIWVEPSEQNAQLVHRSLAEFGAPIDDLSVADLQDSDVVFQVGVAPIRIDILNSISGVTFAQAWPDRVQTCYGETVVQVIGLAALIANKTASARPQDLVDVARLTKAKTAGR